MLYHREGLAASMCKRHPGLKVAQLRAFVWNRHKKNRCPSIVWLRSCARAARRAGGAA